MKIVIIGPKGAGKTTIGRILANRLGIEALETDREIEKLHAEETGEEKTCREIFRERGEDYFRELERRAVERVADLEWKIIITGGGTFMDPRSRRRLRRDAIILYFTASTEVLWQRTLLEGLPPWLEGPMAQMAFDEQLTFRDEVMRPMADALIDTSSSAPEQLAEECVEEISRELAVRCRAANTFGDVLRVTTFGESHGPAIGCVIEGVRPGVEISEESIQAQLDRRRPGQSKVVTQRKEPDKVHVLSGIFEGKTTGAPIALVIYNEDADPKKYDEIKDMFRPGHADFTFYKKYGFRDHRGGGRSSGRETATRVAAGAIAMEVLRRRGITIRAHAVEIAGIRARTCDYDVIESNPVRCADPEAAKAMEAAILDARKDRDSVGGIIQLDIDGVPPGLGDPVFCKLDARLAHAIMSIGAIKGVEIGDGFALTRLRGSQSNDAMAGGVFLSNHAGGITGGISTGQTIRLRVAVKPTASIASPQPTIDLAGRNVIIEVGGRHDPCIVPRAVPVVEHMAALVLLDAWEIQARLRPEWERGLAGLKV